MVEDGGVEPPTPPCKGGVFPIIPIPHNNFLSQVPHHFSIYYGAFDDDLDIVVSNS